MRVFLSKKAQELIREALELYEDIYWEKIAEKREKSSPIFGEEFKAQ